MKCGTFSSTDNWQNVTVDMETLGKQLLHNVQFIDFVSAGVERHECIMCKIHDSR